VDDGGPVGRIAQLPVWTLLGSSQPKAAGRRSEPSLRVVTATMRRLVHNEITVCRTKYIFAQWSLRHTLSKSLWDQIERPKTWMPRQEERAVRHELAAGSLAVACAAAVRANDRGPGSGRDQVGRDVVTGAIKSSPERDALDTAQFLRRVVVLPKSKRNVRNHFNLNSFRST
jgi:hypothetical protein